MVKATPAELLLQGAPSKEFVMSLNAEKGQCGLLKTSTDEGEQAFDEVMHDPQKAPRCRLYS